jgi:hypothetical protein
MGVLKRRWKKAEKRRQLSARCQPSKYGDGQQNWLTYDIPCKPYVDPTVTEAPNVKVEVFGSLCDCIGFLGRADAEAQHDIFSVSRS